MIKSQFHKTSRTGLPRKSFTTIIVFIFAYAVISFLPIVTEDEHDAVIEPVKINTSSRYLRVIADESSDEPNPAKEDHSSSVDVASSKDESSSENTTATVEFDDSNRAIALISFGEAASESTLLERCILSIRRRGKFNGQVIVITDAPKDRYAGEFDENVTVLQAEEDDIRYGYYSDGEC